MLRFAKDYAHEKTGIVFSSSHEVTNILDSITTDLNKLVNRTDSRPDIQETLKNDNITDITEDFLEIIQNKSHAIILSLTNNSDVDRVQHELVKLEGNIRKLLDKNTLLKKFPRKHIETELTEIQKKIKKILWQSPEEELVDILNTTEDKIYDAIKKQALELEKLLKDTTEETTRTHRFMTNATAEIQEILTEAIEDSVSVRYKEETFNHLYLKTKHVVEILNTTTLMTSETFKGAKQELKQAKNVVEKLETFKIFTGTMLSTVRNSFDRITIGHLNWCGGLI